jgi:DNA-binding NtrC family response regulator
MIVNDNTDLIELFKTALELQGIETYTFTDATLALKKIKADPNQFYLIIINYSSQLKRYRGKFAKEAKTINKSIKIILTSGYNFSARDISNNGYDEFFTTSSQTVYVSVNSQGTTKSLIVVVIDHFSNI